MRPPALPLLLAASALLFAPLPALADPPRWSAPINFTLPLWPHAAPRAVGNAPADIPAMQVYLPDPGTVSKGIGLIVVPGGGYIYLNFPYEGESMARWLTSQGLTAFVLRYRISPRYRFPTQLLDIQRAVRYVRYHASAWHVNQSRIGVLGFSAGGHLSSMAVNLPPFAVHRPDPVDLVSPYPDVHVLVYSVIAMLGPGAYIPAVKALLGPRPGVLLETQTSTDLQVSAARTTPAFVFHCIYDSKVSVLNSDRYAQALKQHDIPHMYLRDPCLGHGYGLAMDSWNESALAFVRAALHAA